MSRRFFVVSVAKMSAFASIFFRKSKWKIPETIQNPPFFCRRAIVPCHPARGRCHRPKGEIRLPGLYRSHLYRHRRPALPRGRDRHQVRRLPHFGRPARPSALFRLARDRRHRGRVRNQHLFHAQSVRGRAERL